MEDLTGRAGRLCPLDYALSPALFGQTAMVSSDVLYLAGGLYGNPFALATIESMLAAETGRDKKLCLNGDYHWFDVRRDWFGQIEQSAIRHDRTRGNVETEISRGGNTEAGCGCAYPDSVADDDVIRSNAIMRELARVARLALGENPVTGLGLLPAVARYQVGGLRIGVTHGDDQSLAGWSFAQDQLAASWQTGLAQRMQSMALDVFASSHTCLPVASTHAGMDKQALAVINNGSAGMANFSGTDFGLITRIAHADAGRPPVPALFETVLNGVSISAVPVHFDMKEWFALFSSVWPEGSAAHESYAARILNGPSYSVEQACHGQFRLHGEAEPIFRNAA